jgi:hypothetical protein
MSRDFELIRKLLIFFDKKEGSGYVKLEEIEVGAEYSTDRVHYHLKLLYLGGLLECETERSSTSDRIIKVHPFDLTWKGHEFLAKISSETVWQKAKSLALSKGGSLTFNVLNQAATRLVLEMAGLKDGA